MIAKTAQTRCQKNAPALVFSKKKYTGCETEWEELWKRNTSVETKMKKKKWKRSGGMGAGWQMSTSRQQKKPVEQTTFSSKTGRCKGEHQISEVRS